MQKYIGEAVRRCVAGVASISSATSANQASCAVLPAEDGYRSYIVAYPPDLTPSKSKLQHRQ